MAGTAAQRGSPVTASAAIPGLVLISRVGPPATPTRRLSAKAARVTAAVPQLARPNAGGPAPGQGAPTALRLSPPPTPATPENGLETGAEWTNNGISRTAPQIVGPSNAAVRNAECAVTAAARKTARPLRSVGATT